MQPEGDEESVEMSPHEVGGSIPHGDTVQFTVQRIADALNTMEIWLLNPHSDKKMLHGMVHCLGPHCALSRHTHL